MVTPDCNCCWSGLINATLRHNLVASITRCPQRLNVFCQGNQQSCQLSQTAHSNFAVFMSKQKEKVHQPPYPQFHSCTFMYLQFINPASPHPWPFTLLTGFVLFALLLLSCTFSWQTFLTTSYAVLVVAILNLRWPFWSCPEAIHSYSEFTRSHSEAVLLLEKYW